MHVYTGIQAVEVTVAKNNANLRGYTDMAAESILEVKTRIRRTVAAHIAYRRTERFLPAPDSGIGIVGYCGKDCQCQKQTEAKCVADSHVIMLRSF